MFINTPLKASKPKHIVYLIATSILGILVNYFILILIQVVILQLIMHSERNLIWYSGYPPHLIFISGFLIAGAVWGFILGRYWWRIIYIEHRYRKYLEARSKNCL